MYCKELDKNFETKKDLFAELKANKEAIIQLKKSAIKSKDCGFSLASKSTVKKEEQELRNLKFGDTVKVAMNTAYYIDYDLDMGIEGTWKRSVDQQNGKTYHVVNHDLKVGSVVAYPKDVTLSLPKIPWIDLGKNYAGDTEVLVFETKMSEKTQKDAFMAYRDGDEVQHSIRLRYIQLDLAMNSKEPSDKEEKAVWDKYYPLAVNKEVADESGYFWVMRESQIYKEGSTVLLGANEMTPQLKNNDPLHDTHGDSSNDTHIENDSSEKEENIYEFLIKGLQNE